MAGNDTDILGTTPEVADFNQASAAFRELAKLCVSDEHKTVNRRGVDDGENLKVTFSLGDRQVAVYVLDKTHLTGVRHGEVNVGSPLFMAKWFAAMRGESGGDFIKDFFTRTDLDKDAVLDVLRATDSTGTPGLHAAMANGKDGVLATALTCLHHLPSETHISEDEICNLLYAKNAAGRSGFQAFFDPTSNARPDKQDLEAVAMTWQGAIKTAS